MSISNEGFAEKLVDVAEIDDVIFTRTSKVDNLLQLIYEQKVSMETFNEAVNADVPAEEQKKLLNFFANSLVKYLSDKLVKTRLSGMKDKAAAGKEKQVKLSKSEQFVENRKKQAREKELKDKKSEGTIEKIGLKEIGQEMEEQIAREKELEEKRTEHQKGVQDEQKKHIGAYQCAFDFFALAIASATNKDTSKLEEAVKKIGSESITSRQAALDKISSMPECKLAVNALLAALKDKNILIQVVKALEHTGSKNAVMPLLDLIKNNPTKEDILFRGPAVRSLGGILKKINDAQKGAGVKLMYLVFEKPENETLLKVLVRVVSKDLNNAKVKTEYYLPVCIKWMGMVCDKLIEVKKKKVKVGFVNMAVQTDLTKELKDFSTTLKA